MRPEPIWYEKPVYYMGSHINFFTDGDTLPWPAYSQALDYELDVEVQINAISCGRGNTAGMRHSIGEMAAYASLGERVVPGELLATGTIPGCSGMETNQWLAPGDEIELEIDGIGTLRNIVGAPTARA